MEFYDFTPDPISLLESNRSLGYNIEEAIADLIDNSITAGASFISYELHWNNGSPYFLLRDNGQGMGEGDNDLVNSFRLGSKNPLDERSPKDLGRFGLGMKTASLSQARVLTVITRSTQKEVTGMTLDLNFIEEQKGKWLLKSVEPNLLLNEFDFFKKNETGTVVRWDNWDRAPSLETDFNALNSRIQNYLKVCFHRFIERGIQICASDYPLEGCSPIPKGEGAEFVSSRPLSNNKEARQSSYILQHPKNWVEDYENIKRFNSFRLFDGFESQQGIYIYRCDRLLNPKGGWLGLLNNSNASKLARMVIDYPNNADELWSLDITKTNANIPWEFREEVKKLVEITRKRSINKIIRGNREVSERLSSSHSAIWKFKEHKEFNSVKYFIDIEHPIFQSFILDGRFKKKDLTYILSLISENVPVAQIIENNDTDPSIHDRMLVKNELSQSDIEIAKLLFQEQMKAGTVAYALTWLLNFEPYCYFEDQLKKELRVI